MIQIEEWITVAAVILIVFAISYLIYFKITKKLFPQNTNFKTEIKPGEGATVCEIEGSGILKIIELKTNENCIIDISIDGVSHTLLAVGQEPGLYDPCKHNEDILTVREQLDETFVGNSAIHIQNRGAGILHSSGAVSFEVKKGLKESLRAIFSELKTQKNDS